MTVTRLTAGNVAEIVSVLTDAFHDYPVMRYTLGVRQPYEARLPRLVELFVSSRALLEEPMFGVRDATGGLVGAAVTTSPVAPDPPHTLVELREVIWTELGDDARARYDEYVAATSQFTITEPHHHLNMIGVRRAQHGRGVARALLEAIHTLSEHDGGSAGVSLTTEVPSNVTLYEHFGYRVQGYARIAPDFETWTLFRPSVPTDR